MKIIETIAKQEIEPYTFQIYKITHRDTCYVILKNLDKSPFGVWAVIKYKNLNNEFQSPFLSWYNLFFCSNCYGPAPFYPYMNNAVQNGTKTAATAYVNKEEFRKLIKDLPANCYAVPYNSSEDNMSMAYVYREGTLDELFGYEKIKEVYYSHQVTGIDWDYIKRMFSKPLSYFANENKSGISLQGCAKRDELLVGLLLGYPVEATVAYINKTISYFTPSRYTDIENVRKHFQFSSEPYFDSLNQKWLKCGDDIFLDGQQEELYFN